MAEIAFEGIGVIIVCGGRDGNGAGWVVFEELLGDDVIRVTAADLLKDGVAVELLGVRAGAGLEMCSDAGGGRECAAAERTGDVGAAVDVGIEVLKSHC